MAKKKFFKKDKPEPDVEKLEREGIFEPSEESELSEEELLEIEEKKQELFNKYGKKHQNRFAEVMQRTDTLYSNGYVSSRKGTVHAQSDEIFNINALERKIQQIVQQEVSKVIIEMLEENKVNNG